MRGTLSFKVEVGGVGKVFFTELFEKPCFSTQTDISEEERFFGRQAFPVDKLRVISVSVHGEIFALAARLNRGVPCNFHMYFAVISCNTDM